MKLFRNFHSFPKGQVLKGERETLSPPKCDCVSSCQIKRYHLVFGGVLLLLLSAMGIFSFAYRLNTQSFPSLQNEGTMKSEMNRYSGNEVLKSDAQHIDPNIHSVPKMAVLTFDDGPHAEYTEKLLKILRNCGVPAVFFVVGKQVEKYPELLEKIYLEGHEIANHSYSHRDLRTLSQKELTEELLKTHQLVRSLTGQEMKYYRPPGGQYNSGVMRIADRLNYTLALWSVFPEDHRNPPPEMIRSRVLKEIDNGGVILFHSGVENTLNVLPQLILTLKQQGYLFGTLSQIESSSSSSSGSSSIVHLAKTPVKK